MLGRGPLAGVVQPQHQEGGAAVGGASDPVGDLDAVHLAAVETGLRERQVPHQGAVLAGQVAQLGLVVLERAVRRAAGRQRGADRAGGVLRIEAVALGLAGHQVGDQHLRVEPGRLEACPLRGGVQDDVDALGAAVLGEVEPEGSDRLGVGVHPHQLWGPGAFAGDGGRRERGTDREQAGDDRAGDGTGEREAGGAAGAGHDCATHRPRRGHGTRAGWDPVHSRWPGQPAARRSPTSRRWVSSTTASRAPRSASR